MQHAEYFTKVKNEQEASRKERFIASKPIDNESSAMEKSTIVNEVSKDEVVKKTKVVANVEKAAKSETKAI